MRIPQKVRVANLAFAVAVFCVVTWFGFSHLTSQMFSNEGFMPHGHCYLWTPSLVWTMVVTDALIGLAYVTISICLYILVRRIRLPFSAMFLAFGAFIAACGATHFMSIYTLWYPNYWLDALVKVITALASVATAILMFPLFPKVVEFAAASRLSEERRQQLEELNRELETRSRELVASNKELEAFSYTVSHDLRAPLRGMDGFSLALIEDYGGRLDQDGLKYLNHIRTSSQRMGQIIDDLLSLSRITRTELRKQPVDLTAFAQEIIHYLQSQSPERKVEVFIQQGLEAQGDSGLLHILVDNLVANAWKFSSKTIGARVEVGAETKSGEKVFFVRDNGVGFDMKFSDKLFGPFQRLHSINEYPGTGVGLATAKRIIVRHGGRIWAESAVGKGTTVYFTL
jgi:signal transduction histidine kinase